jgi:hypothetical protein
MSFFTKLVEWFKAASKLKLIQDIIASAADGKLSPEEMATIIADIQALVSKK